MTDITTIDTTTIPYPYGNWSVTVPTVAYQAALDVIRAGGSQHKVFTTFKEHGVPVRAGPGKYPASQATTALMSRHFKGLLPIPTIEPTPEPLGRIECTFGKLRGFRLNQEEAKHLVYKILAPCLAGTGMHIELTDAKTGAALR